jgi:GT2 family glycosyltransferase
MVSRPGDVPVYCRHPSPPLIAVIPAYLARPHEPNQLQRCAAAVCSQPLVRRLIVVDDGSPLAFPPLPPGVELLRMERNGGPAAARNRGLARALELEAETILFTDVDCIPDPGWAQAMADLLGTVGVVAAGGLTRSHGTTLLDRYHDFNGTLNGRWVLPDRAGLLYAPTCNLAVRATAVADLRFDERLITGEDVDFCHRLRDRGTIALAPRAVVHHDYAYGTTRRGLSTFLRMFRRYGEGDWLLWAKHPELRDADSEACAAADLLAPPPLEPSGYRRGASSRVRPRRFRLPMVILRRLARWAYKRGQATPRQWHQP